MPHQPPLFPETEAADEATPSDTKPDSHSHRPSDDSAPRNPHRPGTVRWWALHAACQLPTPCTVDEVTAFIRERAPEVGSRPRLPNQVWAALEHSELIVRVDRGMFALRSTHDALAGDD